MPPQINSETLQGARAGPQTGGRPPTARRMSRFGNEIECSRRGRQGSTPAVPTIHLHRLSSRCRVVCPVVVPAGSERAGDAASAAPPDGAPTESSYLRSLRCARHPATEGTSALPTNAGTKSRTCIEPGDRPELIDPKAAVRDSLARFPRPARPERVVPMYLFPDCHP